MFLLKFLVVAVAAVFAFRRSGLLRHPMVRALLRPGPAPRGDAPPRRPWSGDRLFLFLVVVGLAFSAVLRRARRVSMGGRTSTASAVAVHPGARVGVLPQRAER